MRVSLDGHDLFLYAGFALQDVKRPSGRLRNKGLVIPGVSGIETNLTAALEHDAVTLELRGFARGDRANLKSLVLGSTAWRPLVFDDQYPCWYQVRGEYVDEEWPVGGVYPLSLGFTVSPPCLLGRKITATTSPVSNPGDFPCPAKWTIAAAGNITLTVEAFSCVWTGGAGTVVIDAETYDVTKNGAAAPQYLAGGFPWLAPGDNDTALTSGSFLCEFYPRYA